MGVDFIWKAAKSFHKGLDRSRLDLATPGLFTRQPSCEPRAYAAKIREGNRLIPGEELSVRLQEDKILAQRCMDVVAEFESPPDELLEALEESFGEAYGKVVAVHDIADMAEITIC